MKIIFIFTFIFVCGLALGEEKRTKFEKKTVVVADPKRHRLICKSVVHGYRLWQLYTRWLNENGLNYEDIQLVGYLFSCLNFWINFFVKKENGKFKEYRIDVKDPKLFFLTLCKICENTGFRWTLFPSIMTKSTILSLYRKIWVSENPYSDIFYAV